MEYKDIQRIAKETISYIKTAIKPNMNLLDIRRLCEEKMLSLGADSFWYWDIGASVFREMKQRYPYPDGNMLHPTG